MDLSFLKAILFKLHDQITKHTQTNVHLALAQSFHFIDVSLFDGLANDIPSSFKKFVIFF